MCARVLFVVTALLFLASCEKQSALVVLEPKGSNAQVSLEPIAQLIANRTTHVAVDAIGNLYWSQETDDGQDLVFVTGMSANLGANLPQPSKLSSASILNAIKPVATGSPTTRGGGRVRNSGNIQSLVSGNDGAIYFYFNGGAGATGAQAVGRFDPRTGEIQIIADTQQLASLSEMGRSLDLARGQLLVCGGVIRVFLRHSDAWALLDFEPTRLPVIGQAQLQRSIRSVRIDDPIELRSLDIDLAVGPTIDGVTSQSVLRNNLLMIDRKAGAMFVIDQVGRAKYFTSIVGISETLSRPTIESMADREGKRTERILFFAGDGPRIDPPNFSRSDAPTLTVAYPALLMLDAGSGTFSAIGKDDIHGPGQFAIYATKLQQLVPLSRDTFVGYDSSSGQVLRVSVTGR